MTLSRPFTFSYFTLGAIVAIGCGSEHTPALRDPDPQSQVVPVDEGGFGAPLVPVRIGKRTYRLLLDTGSDYLVVFDSLVPADDPGVRRTDERLSLTYGSGTRSGRIAVAEVQIGQQIDDEHRLLLVDDPTPSTDPSLAAKRADGVLGFRFEPGSATPTTRGKLDVATIALGVHRWELRLPGSGAPGSLVLNVLPTFDALPDRTFTARFEDDPAFAAGRCEVPFRLASPAGALGATRNLLLDTGAGATLAVDASIASAIGLDGLAPDAALTATLDAPGAPATFGPELRAADVDDRRVPPGNTYGAVAGLPWLRSYVFGFELDPAARRGAVRLLDLRGGPVPAPTPTEDTTGEPRFLVDHDLEGATATLDGAPLPVGAEVPFPKRGFTLDVTRAIRTRDGAPFRRRYVRRYEPREGFEQGVCRMEVSEGVIAADFTLAGSEAADPTQGCAPCGRFRTCGATMTLERVETVP